ncbi:hypothetical protein [Arthrobacter bambusae]|uniref:Uncharacterized protein n=1 Tax=Arthrobacter bambusae TaxID=1338426 RepID=A0AAW8DJM6_9MICC|nr:hypothetical protein [Arthrobacter bambusae]MDP9905890.1 hypothetical protein [Arthrobacter bambusae]MDQ0130121.1 hypothetical protein [Arthrobacter bambusae]MDQ0181501.1 hypothetical protein [Arthrobacter bambusae]
MQFSLVSVCDEGPRRALKNSVYLFFRLPKRNIDEAFVRRVVDHAHDSFTIGDQMIIKRILACLAMAAILAASTATPAIADVDANAGGAPAGVENAPKEAAKAEAVARKVFESDNPELAAKSLGSEELGLFEAYSAVANVISSPKSYAPADSLAKKSTLKGITPAQFGTLASGCWNTSSWVIGTNAFGGWLYKLTVSGGWCGNGSSATHSWFNGTWGETFAIGWRDNGQVSRHAIISGGSAKIVGQREFKLGVGGWDVSSPRPCVRIIGHGNGQKGDDQSCSPW